MKILCLPIILYLVSTTYEVICNDIANFKKPNTLPKFFGIDIDGTFYIEDADMMKKNVEAFKLLKNKNIIPFFCTGQIFECVKKAMMSSFNNDDQYFYPGVYFNGGLIFNSSKDIIFKGVFEKEFIKKIIQFVNTNNLKESCLFLTHEGLFSLNDITELKDELTLGLDYEVKTQNEIEDMEIISIRFKFTNNFNIGVRNKDYRRYDENNITIIVFGDAWKHKGVLKLLENLGGKNNELAYIGDGNNDVCIMKQNEVLSFAVNNAKNEVKQKAKWVLDINYDQGAFAKVVELLLKEEAVTSN